MDAITQIIQEIKEAREKNGYTPPKYECSICKDTETIFYMKDGYEYAKPCECAAKKAAMRRMKNSGIGEQDTKKGFAAFETFGEKPLIDAKTTSTDYYKRFDEIKGERDNSILLSGASGRGKTTLGLAVANNLMQSKNVAVLYMPYRDEITALKQEITDEYNYNERMRRLKNAPVLFIDDMLKGKITESDLNILYEIINHRYLARLPLIISTEKTPQELIDFDEATGSRILEMSKSHTVVFDKSVKNYRLR